MNNDDIRVIHTKRFRTYLKNKKTLLIFTSLEAIDAIFNLLFHYHGNCLVILMFFASTF